MEEKIRRVLRAKGPMKDWEIKQLTSANKKGLWVFKMAKGNLRDANEIGFDPKKKRYFLRDE
jgi:hypothetical protein